MGLPIGRSSRPIFKCGRTHQPNGQKADKARVRLGRLVGVALKHRYVACNNMDLRYPYVECIFYVGRICEFEGSDLLSPVVDL